MMLIDQNSNDTWSTVIRSPKKKNKSTHPIEQRRKEGNYLKGTATSTRNSKQCSFITSSISSFSGIIASEKSKEINHDNKTHCGSVNNTYVNNTETKLERFPLQELNPRSIRLASAANVDEMVTSPSKVRRTPIGAERAKCSILRDTCSLSVSSEVDFTPFYQKRLQIPSFVLQSIISGIQSSG